MEEELNIENITEAVIFAESITNAEIKVVIKQKSTTMFQKLRPFVSMKRLISFYAVREFNRQKLHKTKGRNAILLYFSIFERRFEILADINAYNQIGQKFLDEISDAISSELKNSNGLNCEAIAKNVKHIATSLSKIYPKSSDSASNEISDDIVLE